MAKETIRACPRCGSLDLKWVGGGANAIFDYLGTTALSGFMICNGCGQQVLPLEFDSRKNYKKFVEIIRKKEQ